MTTSTPRAHKRPFGDSYLNIHLYQKTSSKKEKKSHRRLAIPQTQRQKATMGEAAPSPLRLLPARPRASAEQPLRVPRAGLASHGPRWAPAGRGAPGSSLAEAATPRTTFRWRATSLHLSCP